MKLNTVFFLVLISVFLTPFAYSANVEKKWSYRPETGYVDGSPAVADLDADGIKDMVFATISGRVIALNSVGLRIWFHDTHETITTPPAVADIDNDGIKEVLVYSNKGNITCLNGITGEVNWRYSMPGEIIWGGTSLVVADITGKSDLEVIASDTGGDLVCLNSKGKEVWKKRFSEKFNSAPAVAKLQDDEKLNILIGSSRSPLICISNKGKEKWRVKDDKSSGSGPLVFDIDNDNSPEIIVGTGTELTVFDAAGNKKWASEMDGEVHDAVSVGDINGDEKSEVIVDDLKGNVKGFSSDGEMLWEAKVPLRARRSATIADVDGDSKPEILVASYSPDLYVFDNEGNLKNKVPLKGAMNSSATIVDFKGDGCLTVVCGANSFISAFNLGEKQSAGTPEVLFPEYRFNSFRTGSSTVEVNSETKMTDAVKGALQNMYGSFVPQFTKEINELKTEIGDMRSELDPKNQAYDFENEGNLKNKVPLKGAMNSSATFVDFKGDGSLTVVCGANSFISAFNFDEKQSSDIPEVLFPEYRFNSFRTGSSTVEVNSETKMTDAVKGALQKMYGGFVPQFTKEINELKTEIGDMR
jgi:outer membrane protein assembly factor BamB